MSDLLHISVKLPLFLFRSTIGVRILSIKQIYVRNIVCWFYSGGHGIARLFVTKKYTKIKNINLITFGVKNIAIQPSSFYIYCWNVSILLFSILSFLIIKI